MIYFGDTKPEGWLKSEIQKSMEGCIGQLDKLLPDLLAEHKIYGKDRIHPDSRLVELGRKDCKLHGIVENNDQYFWWNSESQSNWRDGFCRSALLLEEEKWEQKVREYVEEMLETQDDDGYMGIYGPDLRFQCQGENGELWAQSTLLRALLGYYEAAKEEKVLRAVENAAERIMKGYPRGKSHPFCVEGSNSGHSHGLTVVDAFYRLYQLTGRHEFAEYAVWLYEDFSSWIVGEEDLKSENIRNPFYLFYCHGVHTYEHIRALIIAAREKQEYENVLELLLAKLPYYLTPSGGPVGDEWIFKRTADATWTGYEYCSVQELLHSYLFLMECTGDLKWGDEAEWLFYNAGFGMRHPAESSIMYCMTDNCYTADERKHPDDAQWNPRYKFSPTHKDVAVCCVPNSGRIIPYYVQSMFVEDEDGYKAGLYGPCKFKGCYNGVHVEIHEETNYPFDFHVELEVTVEKPVEMSICLRFPKWADTAVVNGRKYARNEISNGEIMIRRCWNGTEKIAISFETEIRIGSDFNRDSYVSYGPVLYAVPLESVGKVIKKLDVEPFAEKIYEPVDRKWEKLKIADDDVDKFRFAGEKNPDSFRNLRIKGVFRLGDQIVEKDMIPMGETILRKVTFENIR